MNRMNLLAGSALVACMFAVGQTACAQEARGFNIPAGSLRDALNAYATQSDQQIFFAGELVAGLRSPGLHGRYSPASALDVLLAGSGLTWSQTRPGVIVLRRGQASAAISDPTELGDVVVTGSLLRSSGDLASPVIIIGRDDLDRRGFGTVAETLTSLPQNYAGSATPVVQATLSDAAASNTVYATGVNLRGLGPGSTLTLVNGRRLAGTGSRAEFADVSALPSAAVERVDVLLDGASALYGADAVAGVVNVIMRRSFDGHESRLRVSALQGGGEDLQASHLAGGSWSSGSAYLSYEHQTANGLSSLDRDYTRDGDLRSYGGTDRRGFYSSPGNIVAFDPATSAYVTLFGIRPNASGTAQGTADFVAGTANLQSTLLGVDLLPSLERHSAYGSLRQSLGERLELTADLRYNLRTNEIATAGAGGIFSVSDANPWFVSPTGATSHTIAYSFARELGPARSHARSESFGVTVGARLDLSAAWTVEGYLAQASERADYGLTNRVNSRFVNEALGNLPDDPATPFQASVDGYLNLFGGGTANSRAVLDFIGGGSAGGRERSRATSANLMAQGPLWRLPGGDLMLAVGAQIREETFDTGGHSFLSAASPILYSSPRRERSVSAAFAEVRAPLVGPDNARPGLRSLVVSLAGRVEDYDEFGTTTNPKVGVLWSPVEGLALRTSWGSSFRAGSLPQRFDQTGVSAAFLEREDGSTALTLLLTGGNADLEPETSETFTVGLDYKGRGEGRPGVSLNYFETRFSDRIARPVNENLYGALIDPNLRPFVTFVSPATSPADLALVESYSGLPGFSGLYPTDTYGAIVDSRWVNTGAVKVRGLDLSARYEWEAPFGLLAFDTSASWILDYETRPTPTAAVRQVAGLIGYPVKLRARSGVTWSDGPLQLGVHWSHVDDYEDFAGQTIAAWDTLDARFSWSLDRAPFNGLRLQVGVQNLLDEDPPFYDAPLGFGFDAGQASLAGRAVSFQLIQRW